MKQKPLIALSLYLMVSLSESHGQNVAINATGSTPDTSAMLDISSTNKGLLIPRMTTAQIASIPLPATGLLAFSTTDSTFKFNTGTSSSASWVSLFSNNSVWGLLGNSGINSGSQFLGTTNNASLRFRTNNTERMVLDSNGRIGFGIAPTAVLHLKAGTATANTAPLKFTSGVASQTTLETGAVNYNGSDLTLSDASYAYTLDKSLSGSAALDFPNTGSGSVADLNITVTGAAVGDPVILGVPDASVSGTAMFMAWVSAANTVTVRFSPKNILGENPASGTFKVRVIK
ncbi:hypothetical protein ACQ33O_04080 [Ferruginibacter sp. SUN002]|uniref:hypothetical protein n=1 Tax=Ferruginibacter sp. SUN002 TaxID=2937789 RepID=UPI003D359ED5